MRCAGQAFAAASSDSADLSFSAATTMLYSFDLTRLDYCNPIFVVAEIQVATAPVGPELRRSASDQST